MIHRLINTCLLLAAYYLLFLHHLLQFFELLYKEASFVPDEKIDGREYIYKWKYKIINMLESWMCLGNIELRYAESACGRPSMVILLTKNVK
jgi:membrane-anchored glycerophosphoryl diester phosphodiesterase (GDPDase)